MTILRSAGLIRSIRGAKGGYVLVRPPNQIKLNEVFDCLEGPVTTVECIDNKNYCGRIADCVAREVWVKVQNAIVEVLRSINLQELVDKTKGKPGSEYQI
jgi:Rrf2 family cysteine metabolism transcriptional repressor